MPDSAPAGISASAVTTSRPCAEMSPLCSSVRLKAGFCATQTATITNRAAIDTLRRTVNILTKRSSMKRPPGDRVLQGTTIGAQSEAPLLGAQRLHDVDARGSQRGKRRGDHGGYEQDGGRSDHRHETGNLQAIDVARGEPSEREPGGGADDDPGGGHDRSFRQHAGEQVPRMRPDGKPDPELARASAHRER